MSKNIRLKMNGQSINLYDVKYIETYSEDGEPCLWIPEDDTRLTVLMNSVEGTYRPPIGIMGYSRAEVGPISGIDDDDFGVLTVTKNGVYRSDSDENGPFIGYKKVIVNVQPEEGNNHD